MTDAVSDTGPFIHLQEIDRLAALKIFQSLAVPPLVLAECREYGIILTDRDLLPTHVSIEPVPPSESESIIQSARPQVLHPADAQVAVLWRQWPSWPVLTDDLALRRYLEVQGAIVVGTVGILVRAYQLSVIGRVELSQAVDDLFGRSTLRLSKAFRTFVRQLISELW